MSHFCPAVQLRGVVWAGGFHEAIAPILFARGGTGELSLSGAADEIILATAIEQERVIVTADLDFPRLFSKIGTSGPGLLLLRGGNFTEAESLECVRRVLFTIPHEELSRSIVVADRERIRRRWLPIR